MRPILGGRIKADGLTLVFSTLLLVALIWWLVGAAVGKANPLAMLAFGFGLGLLIGDQSRILAIRRTP